ncbi:MAG: hypothetical protein ACE5KF_02555 [Kiloniellaceae bacterium]
MPRFGEPGENLTDVELMASEDLKSRMCERPPPPRSIAQTTIPLNNLIGLLLKTMYVVGIETSSQLADSLKLNTAMINSLLDEIKDRGLVENLGVVGARLHTEFRFALTAKGRDWAMEALAQSQYVGPAPVSLDDFRRQVYRQRLRNEQVDRDTLITALSGLVVSDVLVRRLGPAINSERSILLYGPPGNGKTTIGEVIGGIFKQIIHIPYCMEVDGTIIKVFDPALHRPVEDDLAANGGDPEKEVNLRLEDIDRRWVACHRPIVVTGGELTLEMLDLSFNPFSRYYEAPLHVKAIGGTFVCDDLGRQLVRAEDLLNRWITPMEKRIDYLKLNTGKSFQVPFDELLVFSTNLLPEDIMDPAFLRRIPYKVELGAPSLEEYRTLFKMLGEQHGIAYREGLADYVAEKLTTTFEQPLSFYQPRFIVEQCIAACKYAGTPVEMTDALVDDAMENLSAKSESADEQVVLAGGNGMEQAVAPTGKGIPRPNERAPG